MDFKRTKIIDQYLSNELHSEERLAFEAELIASSELQQELELQTLVYEGARRASQRELIKKARKGYHLNKLLKWGFISLSCIALGLFASLTFFSPSSFDSKTSDADNNKVLLASNFDLKSSESLLIGKSEKVGFPISNEESDELIMAQIPNSLIAKRHHFWINPKADTNVLLDNRGTSLFVPRNAFVDKNGKIVKERVKLEYQEYRDAADMIFSGIPMTYTPDEEEFNFNSSGMFSLFGTVKGKPVNVRHDKPLKIDFKLARKNPNTNFYVLKEDSSNWDFVAEIEKLPDAKWGAGNDENQEPEFTEEEVLDNLDQLIGDTLEGELEWGVAVEPPVENNMPRERVIHRGRLKPVIVRDPMPIDAQVGWAEAAEEQRKKNPQAGTLLAAGIDAGHTYPDIVRGLNVGRFGVYNCDQIYRVRNLVTLKPTYLDQNGQEIRDGAIVSMIDLNYNGAFSFDPKWVSCNRTGNNVFLLFTKSGKLYLLDKGEFKNVAISGSKCTFNMKDVTATIRSTEDLRNHLDL
jgi:hypothetical protein